MTDDETPFEETEMPRLAIDNNRLDDAIDRSHEKAVLHGDAIHTSAQQRLMAEFDRKIELQREIAEVEAQNRKLADQITQLQSLLAKGEANSRDANIELKGVLHSIHAMESEGLSI